MRAYIHVEKRWDVPPVAWHPKPRSTLYGALLLLTDYGVGAPIAGAPDLTKGIVHGMIVAWRLCMTEEDRCVWRCRGGEDGEAIVYSLGRVSHRIGEGCTLDMLLGGGSS